MAGILPQAAAIEIYHNYTLLHDDVMDRADLRRGKLYGAQGVGATMRPYSSGDAMLVLAYDYMAQCPPSRLGEGTVRVWTYCFGNLRGAAARHGV